MLAFSSLVSSQPAEAQVTDIYSSGVQELFAQFRNELLKPKECETTKQFTEANAMILFAAMVGTGLLSKASGHTPLIDEMQSAVLSALPGLDQHSETDAT